MTEPESLHAALEHRDTARVVQLLEEDPSRALRPDPPEFPYPPLVSAIISADARLVELLLRHGADPNGIADHPSGIPKGLTMLHFAVERPAAVVECLLRHGADVNARDARGETTPLLHAAFLHDCHRETLEILIRHGADLNARTVRINGGIGVMQAAGVANSQDLLKLLEEHGLPLDLRAALKLGRVERVREILRGDPRAVATYHPKPDRLIDDAVLLLAYPTAVDPGVRSEPDYVGHNLDILQAILNQAKGEPWFIISYRTLHSAVKIADPAAVELLLRYAPRPPQGPLIYQTAARNRQCGAEMVALLDRYGIKREGLPGAGQGRNEAVEALIQYLRGEDPVGRLFAVKALGAYGEHAQAAVPALREALADPDPSVRQTAAAALRAIDPQAATEAGLP